ncbi:MAG TPA: DUF4432 domain-containing protein, partial [Spirochaetia bacterium]|nr:DUF4432 domain-containing protein [Spirochaetia bacterium]
MFDKFKINPEILRRYTSSPQQIADIKSSVLDNGKGRGMRILDFYNGRGLFFSLLPDRAMDIGYASVFGIPVSFFTQTGYTHPSFYEPEGLGWLRNFSGGLL